jgi:cell division septum initiation protein DivIVA
MLEQPEPYATEEVRIRRIETPVAVEDDILPRFPVTRQGYDCDAVDAHIADLEDELNDLERQLDEARAQVPSRDVVATEIERVGAQTSAILVAAHDEAQETVRLARTHADTVIADATSYAAALTEEANRTVQELEGRAAALSGEHGRLLGEIRSTAGALHTLADEAAKRYSSAD